VERKFYFDGAHEQKLSAHGSEESWVISLQIAKLQNGHRLNYGKLNLLLVFLFIYVILYIILYNVTPTKKI